MTYSCACGYNYKKELTEENMEQAFFDTFKEVYFNFINNYSKLNATINASSNTLIDEKSYLNYNKEVSYNSDEGLLYLKTYNAANELTRFEKVVDNEGSFELYEMYENEYDQYLVDETYYTIAVSSFLNMFAYDTYILYMNDYDDYSKYAGYYIGYDRYLCFEVQDGKIVFYNNYYAGGIISKALKITIVGDNNIIFKETNFEYDSDKTLTQKEEIIYNVNINKFNQEEYDSSEIEYSDDKFQVPQTIYEQPYVILLSDDDYFMPIAIGAAKLGSTEWYDNIQFNEGYNKEYVKLYYDAEYKVEISKDTPYKSNMTTMYATYNVPTPK